MCFRRIKRKDKQNLHPKNHVSTFSFLLKFFMIFYIVIYCYPFQSRRPFISEGKSNISIFLYDLSIRTLRYRTLVKEWREVLFYGDKSANQFLKEYETSWKERLTVVFVYCSHEKRFWQNVTSRYRQG